MNGNYTVERGVLLQAEIEGDVPRDRDENLAKFEIGTLANIFLITVIGNTIVLLALWTRRRYAGRKKLSRMYFFILHLSVADLITAFLSVLPQLSWDITFRFQGGNFLCKAVKFGQTLGPYLSSYILMATAVDRHQAICHPLTYCSWTSRRSKLMVYASWIASLSFCIPQLTIFSFKEIEEDKGVYDCWATFSEEWGVKAYVIWYCISIFIIPLVVLVYTYTCICWEIWHSSDLRPRNSQKFDSNKRTPFISRAKINTVKQTIAVIVMYIVSSAPFIIGQLWAVIDPDNPFLEGPIFVFLMLLYSLNSCVNPWIYLAFNRELPKMLIKRYRKSRKKFRTPSATKHKLFNADESSIAQALPNESKTFFNSSDYPEPTNLQVLSVGIEKLTKGIISDDNHGLNYSDVDNHGGEPIYIQMNNINSEEIGIMENEENFDIISDEQRTEKCSEGIEKVERQKKKENDHNEDQAKISEAESNYYQHIDQLQKVDEFTQESMF